jgi:uncharacterized protein (DUF305 family)
MQTKPLLYGLIGFFIGGLVVSIAATTFDKPVAQSDEVTMSEMTRSLQSKTGDDFDKAFIAHMIEHHESAVNMAELSASSASNAKHEEIKQLSREIINAQEKEIDQMKQWQSNWSYATDDHRRVGH